VIDMRAIMTATALAVAATAAGYSLLSPDRAEAQSSRTESSRAASSRATAWNIGPIIKGRNYSQGMPLYLTPTRNGSAFDFPYPSARAGHVHYVTRDTASMAGARQIVLRYRIDAAPGTRFVPQEVPDQAATLSLYFQRRGDDWKAKGDRQYYRWYSPSGALVDLSPGVHRLAVDLSAPWISVLGRNSVDQPRAFRDALANAETVGFTFGSAGGRGHGVFATAPARFTVLDFSVR
jgi:hypothetical protein